MRVQTTGITDIGCVRENNEDSFIIDEALGLYAVADGMGGRAHGEVASFQALRVLREAVGAAVRSGRLSHMSEAGLAQVLKSAVSIAADHVDAQCADMGTTLTALWLVGGRGILAHVGDSRLYLRRDTFLRQISEDHTLVGTLVRHGRLSPQEAADHPMRHILLNSIGGTEDLQIDVRVFDVREGDTFMLCSDGLNTHVSDKEIAAAMPDPETSFTAQWLVDLAKVRGGRDNITLVLIRVEHPLASSQSERALDRLAS